MALHAVSMQPSDIASMFSIRDAALIPLQAPISCLLFCPPFSSLIQQREQERLNARNGTLYFKAIDGDDEKMIACMRARIVPVGTTALRPAILLPPWREDFGVGEQTWNSCWTAMGEAKRECFKNVRLIYIDLLATHPAHQRRGAAQCLLDKLTDTADQEGIDKFLVSTDAARPAYERASFVAVKKVTLEANGDTETFTFMIRRTAPRCV